MTISTEHAHVYHRKITQNERTSLSVVASLIRPGAKVLDLGTGSGSLGAYLTVQHQCVVDGATYNAAEAELARPHYRHIVVADLEVCDLNAVFRGERYDYVVCADVLEHIRNPEVVIHACRKLLTDQGRLIISIPNAGYCGLLAELMAGEFEYRDEGLLDRTHLRFFTRQSLSRMIAQCDWRMTSIETVERPLNESEFRAAFDALPPSVARYLLALPDALTYQFVASAGPAERTAPVVSPNGAVGAAAAQALFSAQLFIGMNGQYSEDVKLVAAGVIGQLRQTLRFALPSTGQAITGLKFDPADRPGFFHLYGMRLSAGDGTPLWQWDSQTDSLDALNSAPHHDLLVRPPWQAATAALMLLLGDDPWIELPLPEQLRSSPSQLQGATLSVDMGWPMSADYLALSELMSPLRHQINQLEAWRAQERLELTQSVTQERAFFALRLLEERGDKAHTINLIRGQWEATVAWERGEKQRVVGELQALSQISSELQARQLALEREKQTLVEQQLTMLAQQATLMTDRSVLMTEKTVLSNEKTALQKEIATSATEREALLQAQAMLHQTQAVLQASLLERTSQMAAQGLQMQHDFNTVKQHLEWIENSTVFRVTRPLVHFKMWLQGLLTTTPTAAATLAFTPATLPYDGPRGPAHPVDVIVPVYKGLADTIKCIESVLNSPSTTALRLVVINDASPEPEVTAWLRHAQQRDKRMVLLENEENLGFVGTVNRGMAFSTTHDVVLLNSDAEVANDWLDRISRAAYSDYKIATVTPFSNNATICNYPRFCEATALPPGYTTAQLDALFAKTNAGEVVDVPTGVGFCMYIRRDCLNQVGLFDVENFGKGYGEENDFCCRAASEGWRNLHVLDTFVHHAGGVSFGASKSAREIAAMETLRRLHPNYEREVHQFIAVDPAQSARRKVDLARIQSSTLPVVLAVLHDRAGGTVRHVEELAQHLQGQALFLVLRPAAGGDLSVQWAGRAEALDLRFNATTGFDLLVTALQELGVAHLHFHHLLGHQPQLLSLPARLEISYDFTAHDYYMFCPQISLTDHTNAYCGEKGLDQCRACLQKSAAPGGLSIEAWRAQHGVFLENARCVFAPSQDAAQRFEKVFPQLSVTVVKHTDMTTVSRTPAVCQRKLSPTDPLKIVVIGAMSMIKGADVLEDVAAFAAKEGASLDFHLLGYAYRSLRTRPDTTLTVHGEFAEADLPRLLNELKPDLVWFPAQWPETYSYTLSAALQCGMPVVTTNLGAFAERLAGRDWSWVHRWDVRPLEWVALFSDLRTAHFQTGNAPTHALTAPPSVAEQATPWSYAENYLTGLTPCEGTESKRNTALLQTGSSSGLAAPSRKRHVKQKLLWTLVRLRASPVLRGVARAIPLRWQTRAKTWLRA